MFLLLAQNNLWGCCEDAHNFRWGAPTKYQSSRTGWRLVMMTRKFTPEDFLGAELYALFIQTSSIQDISKSLFIHTINRIARNKWCPYFKICEICTSDKRLTNYIFVNDSEIDLEVNALQISKRKQSINTQIVRKHLKNSKKKHQNNKVCITCMPY